MDSLPAVASKHYAHCKKCDQERYLLVLAHTNETTAKVECEVCHAKSTLKLKKATTAKPRKASVKTKSQVNLANEWQAVMEKTSTVPRSPYQVKAKFSKDAVIDHPHFGHGLVMAVTPLKIDVLFESGIKSLVHNRV